MYASETIQNCKNPPGHIDTLKCEQDANWHLRVMLNKWPHLVFNLSSLCDFSHKDGVILRYAWQIFKNLSSLRDSAVFRYQLEITPEIPL